MQLNVMVPTDARTNGNWHNHLHYRTVL